MRINSRKIRKILGRVWTAPKRIFETFCTQEPLDASAWMQHSQLLFNLENQTKDFSYTIFPVKKNKCWKNFKIMRKSLFNYSFYSHPEIGNFRVWHRLSHKAEVEDQAWLSGQNRPDQFGEPVWPVWGRRAPEASRRRTHIGIARLASRLREVRSPGIHPMGLRRQIPKVPWVGVYPSLGLRGILDFRLASI
jgi:hypothetical protein